MNSFNTVIFDVDGVLLDSLLPHLKICQDKNQEYGLGLKIPTVDEFRKIVHSGVKISPMKYFFEAVGFLPEYADKATLQYNEIFMCDYAPKPFTGVGDMLSRLSESGFKLGIVTSNVRANIKSALGEDMRFFHENAVLTKDDISHDTKAQAILRVANVLGADKSNTIYVGDQPADYEAAKKSGVKFLGVTYGWGISKGDKQFPVVDSVARVTEYILRLND
jgi:phosphoglycolate phosphatase